MAPAGAPDPGARAHDCELCERDAAPSCTRLGAARALPPIELVDVDRDPLLQRRYGLNVPVLLLDGSVVCRHRLDRAELERLLRPVAAARLPADTP